MTSRQGKTDRPPWVPALIHATFFAVFLGAFALFYRTVYGSAAGLIHEGIENAGGVRVLQALAAGLIALCGAYFFYGAWLRLRSVRLEHKASSEAALRRSVRCRLHPGSNEAFSARSTAPVPAARRPAMREGRARPLRSVCPALSACRRMLVPQF